MKLAFPDDFAFGTSTSAYQIETPVDHDWIGVRARDGHHFERTTEHEKFLARDVDIVAHLAPHYRMSLMWDKLQREPYAPFDAAAVHHYHRLLSALRDKGITVMMVLHHFTNPRWFSKLGGWERSENTGAWLDFAKKVVDEFGSYVSSWNTFNEPNLYTSMGWVMGEFPPFRRNLFTAWRVIRNLAAAHEAMYRYIKEKRPAAPVGISHNSTVFAAENFAGRVPAAILDYCFMEYPPSLFAPVDFFGMSYYARIGHDPFPCTYLTTPEKLARKGKLHDDMWEYYPAGLAESVRRYWTRFGKPVIITENGVCTGDDSLRVRAIGDYLTLIHGLITEGIPIVGYYHWSAWDNFEWSLGPTYRFGLYEHDPATGERRKKPSADVYSRIAHTRILDASAVSV